MWFMHKSAMPKKKHDRESLKARQLTARAKFSVTCSGQIKPSVSSKGPRVGAFPDVDETKKGQCRVGLGRPGNGGTLAKLQGGSGCQTGAILL